MNRSTHYVKQTAAAKDKHALLILIKFCWLPVCVTKEAIQRCLNAVFSAWFLNTITVENHRVTVAETILHCCRSPHSGLEGGKKQQKTPPFWRKKKTQFWRKKALFSTIIHLRKKFNYFYQLKCPKFTCLRAHRHTIIEICQTKPLALKKSFSPSQGIK